MWWLIGTLIGTAWNIHEEKKHPELKAQREKEARQGYLGCLIILTFFVVAVILLIIYSSSDAGNSN